MPSSQGDDFQENSQEMAGEQSEVEVEIEAGPRAERPNFLTATRFVDFDLPPEILEGLDKAGFEYCTPIQAQAIPVAMNGQDIAGQAQTGTGKTTAFLVPLLNRLLTNKPIEPDVPRAIIVTPTRELALQIHEDAIVLAGATGLRQALVIGGMEYKEQADLLASGPEIVICTPGRIIDYLQQGVFKTKGIEVAVVDEADRLLDMGFIKDLKYLLGKLPPFTKRQTMLFSATLDERVLELTYQYMNPPQYITAEPDTTTKVNITQELYHVGRDEKLTLLMGLLRREEHQRVIIFVNTKSGVEWLSKKLTMNGFQAEGITGDLPQPKRLKLMEAFKENRLQILVATDVASRGIHVDDVSHVYNYDLPQDAENYVHRIGRTARAGHTGKAVSFGCEDYVFHLEAIENLLGEKIPVFWAEADWFQEDQGGEVHLKDRRGDRRKSAPGGRAGRSDGGERRQSRGPAKSQRPGGIFGLSPRSAGEGAKDVRQSLAWALTEEAGILPPSSLPVAEALEETSPHSPEAVENGNGERESGRRRKRRRGRRGRGAEAPVAELAAVLADPASEDLSRVEKDKPAPTEKETAPTAPVEDRPPKAAARNSRRSSANRPPKSGSAETASPAAAGEGPKKDAVIADSAPLMAETKGKPAAEKKPRSSPPKTSAGKVSADKSAAAKAPKGEDLNAKAENPVTESKTGAKKPRASAKATDAAEKKAQAAAKAAKPSGETAEAAKSPKRAPRKPAEKTEEVKAPEKVAAKKEPSVKKSETAEKSKKTAVKSRSESSDQPAAETKKSGQTSKKSVKPAAKDEKPEPKRAPAKKKDEPGRDEGNKKTRTVSKKVGSRSDDQ